MSKREKDIVTELRGSARERKKEKVEQEDEKRAQKSDIDLPTQGSMLLKTVKHFSTSADRKPRFGPA